MSCWTIAKRYFFVVSMLALAVMWWTAQTKCKKHPPMSLPFKLPLYWKYEETYTSSMLQHLHKRHHCIHSQLWSWLHFQDFPCTKWVINLSSPILLKFTNLIAMISFADHESPVVETAHLFIFISVEQMLPCHGLTFVAYFQGMFCLLCWVLSSCFQWAFENQHATRMDHSSWVL